MRYAVFAALIALAVAGPAVPVSAFVAQVATSIPAATVDSDAQLQEAVYSAVKDMLKHAIAFTPSLVQLQSAKLVGDRIYILLLVADPDGEETLKAFEAAERTSE
jgi:hypothetical protein